MKSIVGASALFAVGMSLCTGAAHGQFYKVHNFDVSGGAIGQSVTPLSTQNTGVVQTNTSSFGGLFSIREHPVSWAGVQFNYAYTEFTERYYASDYTAAVHTDMHEATAQYLFHAHFRGVQPYFGVGGGAVDFVPNRGQNQWRGAGLVSVGFDVPTSNPHMGFRFGGRELVFRDPNFGQPNLASKTWVGITEPFAGVYYRR